MKLRLIAEASARDIIIPEGLFGPRRERGNNARADEISREQTAKNLVVTTLTKLRKMLEPMGLLKAGSKNEPVHEPLISKAFSDLRETVKSVVSRDAQTIVANEEPNLELISKFWGFQIPTGWVDVHAGQAGRATAEGWFDDWIRDAITKMADAPEGKEGANSRFKAQVLKDLANEIYRWSQRN